MKMRKTMTITNTQTIQIDLTEGLNTQQKKAALNPINICTKIVAGAGTGKTKIISKRFVKLVKDLQGQNVENAAEKLLVITFTDKAAGEMKSRIISELNQNGIDCTGQDLWISTIHSFCSRILRKHSIEVGLSPSFEMGEETQLREIFDNILKRIKYNETSIIENINEIASDLDLTPDILSIQSVNKLRSINILDNVFDDIYPLLKKIKSLGITPKTFLEKTLKSTQEFSRITENIPFVGDTKEDYAWCWNEHLKNYVEDSIVLDGEVFDKIAKSKIILDKNGKSKTANWVYATGFPENIPNITELELHLTKIVAFIYAIYQNELEKLDLVDFDDLINKTIQILNQNKVIRSYYQKYFKHIIIDEFQDTNGAQLELIELLLSDDCPNITFVGDRKQSIYGFRFAQMENLEVLSNRIAEKYGNDKLDEITLVTNYRSTPCVLDAVNYVTTNELNLDENLCSGREFGEKNLPIKVDILEGFNDSYTHKTEEAKYIASEIIKLKKENNAAYKDFAILVKSHAHAEIISKLLIKYGIPSIKKVNTGFFANPIIKNLVALLRLINNIRDEIALVRVLKILFTDRDLYKLKLATDKIIEKELDKFAVKNMNLSEKILFIHEKKLWQNIEVSEAISSYVMLVLNTVLSISKNKNTLSLLQIYYKLTNEIKPYANLNGIEQYNTELDLRVFEKIIVDYMQNQNYVSVKLFLDYLGKTIDDKNFELPNLSLKNVDAVQLYTIYASKGLEFPYTFVANIKNKQGNSQENTNISFDLQYGDKPGFGVIIHKFKGKGTAKAVLYNEIWKKTRQKNEDLRLFYVAISRAEYYLNVLSFNPYGHNNGTKPVDYVKNLSDVYISNAINTTEITVEKQDYKPAVSFGKPKIKEEIGGSIYKFGKIQSEFNMSFSKMNTFNNCSAKYLFKYKYNYPELGIVKESSIIGSVVHNLIYTGYLNKKEFSLTEIPIFLSNVNITKEDALKINKLYESFLKTDYTPQKLFKTEFLAERNFVFCYQSDENIVKFSGDIDLLVKENDGSYTIIDFKTNKEIEKSLENYYIQLYLYKIALESEGLTINSLKMINLTEDESKVFEMDEEILSMAKKSFDYELRELIEFDQKNEIPAAEQKKYCKNCGYNYLCEI